MPGTPATDRQMRLGHIAYLLFALGPLTGVSLLLGLFLCRLRLKSEKICGTVLHTHFRWLTGTFIYGLIGASAALVLRWLFGDLAGLGAMLVVLVWFAYRVVRGWLSLYDGKDIANPRAPW